jgi:hypothetical protein
MFGDELLEGDEEAGLDSDAARDGGVAVGGQLHGQRKERKFTYSMGWWPVTK